MMAAAPTVAVHDAPALSSMTVKTLQAELRVRGMDAKGRKAQLLERLGSADAAASTATGVLRETSPEDCNSLAAQPKAKGKTSVDVDAAPSTPLKSTTKGASVRSHKGATTALLTKTRKQLDLGGSKPAMAPILPGGGGRRETIEACLKAAYTQVVSAPKTLNKYKAWSHEVYGETNFSFVRVLEDLEKIGKDDCFWDLGSGVGQVSLHVAAMTDCNSCGVELMPNPAAYADTLNTTFVDKLQNDHGIKLTHTPRLWHGDMFERPELAEATIIFVNNFAFPEELNQRLAKHISATCRAGTRLVSYKPLGGSLLGRGGRTRSGGRAHKAEASATANGQWLHEVERITGLEDMVSWTSNSIPYIRYVIKGGAPL